MSLDRTNPMETDDGRYPKRPSTTAFGPSGATGPAGEPGASAAPGQLQVTVEIGDSVTEVRQFEPGEILVGRRPRNDITIDGEGLKVVSGHHMRFAFESGRWCVEDKGSTNGTFLNGVRVTGLQAISGGDVVELGRPRKVGSYRAVKLKVALIGQPDVQVTGSLDGVTAGLDVTLAPDDTISPEETAVPAEAPKAATTAATPASMLAQTLDSTASSEDTATTSDSAAPVPAAKPEELRALIEKIQDRSRRLGEVSYRLDSHVEDLTSAAIERHGVLGLSDVAGGPEVLEVLAEHDRLESSLEALSAELPGVRERLEKELEPLEEAEGKARAAAEAASARFEEAALRRDESAAAFTQHYGELTAALSEALKPVTAALAHDGSTRPGDEPLWTEWTASLEGGALEIAKRESELSRARVEAAEAAEAARAAEEASEQASHTWEQAKAEADKHRATIGSTVADKEAELATTAAGLEEAKSSRVETAKAFVLAVLAAPEPVAGPLGALAGMDEARRLHGEAEVLRSELADLERGAF